MGNIAYGCSRGARAEPVVDDLSADRAEVRLVVHVPRIVLERRIVRIGCEVRRRPVESTADPAAHDQHSRRRAVVRSPTAILAPRSNVPGRQHIRQTTRRIPADQRICGPVRHLCGYLGRSSAVTAMSCGWTNGKRTTSFINLVSGRSKVYNLGLLQICMLRLGTPCGIVVSNLAAGSATRPLFDAGSSINDLS